MEGALSKNHMKNIKDDNHSRSRSKNQEMMLESSPSSAIVKSSSQDEQMKFFSTRNNMQK
jgi:hypothetical protein